MFYQDLLKWSHKLCQKAPVLFSLSWDVSKMWSDITRLNDPCEKTMGVCQPWSYCFISSGCVALHASHAAISNNQHLSWYLLTCYLSYCSILIHMWMDNFLFLIENYAFNLESISIKLQQKIDNCFKWTFLITLLGNLKFRMLSYL